MKINDRVEGLSLELTDNNQTPDICGGISYNTDCDAISLDTGSNILRVQDNRDLPIGTLLMWPTDTIPTHYVRCEGQPLDRTVYSDLFSVLGTTYGVGDGTTTFNLPDTRGMFVRGTDNGRGCDPDAATRTDRGDGTIGDVVGTTQDFEVQSHTHDYGDRSWNTTERGGQTGGLAADNESRFDTRTSEAAGGAETRPKNINFNYIIKVK